jgi:cytidylate kinase
LRSSDYPNIALSGKSGSGKSTLADILVEEYSYVQCKTGIACRTIARDLFGSESKELLNRLTVAMRGIDDGVWLRAALEGVDGRPIVFDSMRFPEDYGYFKERGYALWKLDAPVEVRAERLSRRGQEFDPDRDDDHPAENSLRGFDFDRTFQNLGSIDELRDTVREAIGNP